MNHLNSVLLEGVLEGNPVIIESENSDFGMCYFPLESDRFFKKADSVQQEKSHFNIVANEHIADYCIKKLISGMSIRIVGRIKSKQDGDHEDLPDLFLVAEHIEVKGRKFCTIN